jgi:hypothetical protein
LGGGVTGGGVDLTANHGVVRVKNAQNVMKKFLHKKKVKKGTIELPISTTVSNVY